MSVQRSNKEKVPVVQGPGVVGSANKSGPGIVDNVNKFSSKTNSDIQMGLDDKKLLGSVRAVKEEYEKRLGIIQVKETDPVMDTIKELHDINSSIYSISRRLSRTLIPMEMAFKNLKETTSEIQKAIASLMDRIPKEVPNGKSKEEK